MKIALLLMLCWMSLCRVCGQSKLDYSTQVQINGKLSNLKQFEGKPLILELFTGECVVCFRKLPAVNELHRMFKDRINFLLLGNDHIKLPKTYDRFREKLNLGMPAAFDNTFFSTFNAPSVPRYYWYDAGGELRGETNFNQVNETNIAAFINNDFSFFSAVAERRPFEGPELIPGNQGKWPFQTAFSGKADSFNFLLPSRLAITEQNPAFRVLNGYVKQLFQYAFFGRLTLSMGDVGYGEIYIEPIIDEDTAVAKVLNQSVCYGMAFDGYRSPTFLQSVLKSDLLYQFGLEGKMEERLMPYWALQRDNEATDFLKTEKKRKTEAGFGGFSYNAVSISEILRLIQQKADIALPLIDETNITWSIDLEIEAVMTDVDDISKALRRKGLLLTKRFRPMQVLKVYASQKIVAAGKLLQQ